MKLPLTRLAVALGVACTLTACGGTSSSTSAHSSEASAAGFPRTIEHAMGSTTIEHAPHRVAALDASYVDATLMLDTQVVAFTEYNTLGSTLPDYLGASAKNYGTSAVSVGKLANPSLEKVVAAKPDLIVSAKVRHERLYQEMSAIAPTIFSQTTGPTWKDNIRLLAKALGKEQLAEQRA